jgi:hypothetical protein
VAAPDVDDVLLISPSAGKQLPACGIVLAFLCGYVVLGSTGVVETWLMWPGIGVFGVALLLGVVGLLRARRAPWELRLGPDGVTLQGCPERPWADVGEVRITGLRPRWLVPWSFGVRVVSFVARPGVELPALPSARLVGPLGRWSAAMRSRWYGSQLILMPLVFDTSTQTVVDAVRRFSDVPVVVE